MLHSLASAAEAGMDVQPEMRKDPYLAKFEMDPRVAGAGAQRAHAAGYAAGEGEPFGRSGRSPGPYQAADGSSATRLFA